MKKKDIIQLVKKLVKEDAYGSATLTTQGPPRTGAIAFTDEYPFSRRPKRTGTGMMEAGPSNNPYYNNLVKKAEEMGIHVNDLMKDLLKDKSEMEIVKMGYQDLAALAGVENLSESQGTLSSDMLNYADQYHMELVDTMKGVSTHPDKRTGGFRILFPHENGPGPGALFGKEVRMQIEKSKAAAKSAALKTVSKFQDQIEDYEISDSSPAGVHGSIHLWIMPKNNMNEEINEAHPLNKVIGGYPVKYEGDPNNYRAIISEPMDDRQKEAMIKRAEEAGYIAKPNMGGGITIFVKESIKESPMFRTGIKQDMAPKEMAGRIKSVFDKVNGAQDPVKTPEWHKNRFKNKYGISFPENIKNINKDQALAMNKYANDMKIREVDTKTYAGMDAIQGIKKDPRFGTLAGDTKLDIEKKLKMGGSVELEGNENQNNETMNNIDHEGRMAKSQMHKMQDYVKKLSIMLDDGAQLPGWVQSKLTKASDYMSSVFHYLEYEAVRGQDNLNEHVDRYKKRAVLMEGAMKKFFEMFDMGKTDEEIIQDYAQRGTQVPETFVGKARKQYEGLKKMKLELEMSEKEYKNSATQIVNNPATNEMDGSTTMETKKLASDLFNEKLDPVGQEDDDINNDGKVDKTDKYLKNKRAKTSAAINKNKTK